MDVAVAVMAVPIVLVAISRKTRKKEKKEINFSFFLVEKSPFKYHKSNSYQAFNRSRKIIY